MSDDLQIPGTREPGCSHQSLARLCAGELKAEEQASVRAHAASCARCGAELAALEREAQDFQREVPFERFQASVAARQRPARRGRVTVPVGLALAAGIAVIVAFGPMRALLRDARHSNTTKGGGSALELFAGGAGQAPRPARDGDALATGERIRVGYQAGSRRFLLVLSVDERGAATALYPAFGRSLAADPSPGTHLMSDSLELTGQGYERVIALFSDEPIDMRAAIAAATKEFVRAGRLDRMGPLPLQAEEQSAVSLKKPEVAEHR